MSEMIIRDGNTGLVDFKLLDTKKASKLLVLWDFKKYWCSKLLQPHLLVR